MNQRSVLTANLGAALTGCGVPATATTSPAPVAVPPPPAAPADDLDLIALEVRSGDRTGVHVLDTGTGPTVSHRGKERFLTASTTNLPLAAAVLDHAATDPDDPGSTAGNASIAEATAIAVRRLVRR